MDIAYPNEYICFIADNTPDAMSNYLMLWREQDEYSRCIYTKDQIRNEKNKSWTKFLNDLRKLTCQGLLEWAFVEQEKIVITLAEYQEDRGPFAC